MTRPGGEAYGRWTMNLGRQRLPPLMHRTLADDLKAAAAVLAGMLLALLVLGDGASVLIGAGIAIVVLLVVLNVARRAIHRDRG